MAILEYFPQEAIVLQQEVIKHPALVYELQRMPHQATLSERFAVIAAYCGMLLEGYYTEDELQKLFHIAIQKLRDKSTSILH